MVNFISKEVIVVGDVEYKVSKLVNCYDQNEKKIVGCIGIKTGDQVDLVLTESFPASAGEVMEIHKVSNR